MPAPVTATTPTSVTPNAILRDFNENVIGNFIDFAAMTDTHNGYGRRREYILPGGSVYVNACTDVTGYTADFVIVKNLSNTELTYNWYHVAADLHFRSPIAPRAILAMPLTRQGAVVLVDYISNPASTHKQVEIILL